MRLGGGKNVSEKSREERNAEGRSLFFDYLKSSLHDNSIQEYQGFDSCSNDNVANDILLTTANDIYLNESIQSDAHVMRGLQKIIPGRRTTVSVTPAGGGNKVNVSLQQLKKELKGGGLKKSPPEQLRAVSDHTLSGSIFISNVSNRTWRNQLSSISMDPHRETRNMAATAGTAATSATVVTAAASTMMGRVKKRVLNVFLTSSLTSPTKKVAAKVHAGAMMLHSHPSSTVSRRFKAHRRSLLPALTCNVQWMLSLGLYLIEDVAWSKIYYYMRNCS
jgi:hypothetical protein